MSYWQRLLSGEQQHVFRYWVDDETKEQLMLVDTRDNDDYKGNYVIFSTEDSELGVYVTAEEAFEALFEQRDLLATDTVWTDGDEQYTVIDPYPEKKTAAHEHYPPDTNQQYVYVKKENAGDRDCIPKEKLTSEMTFAESPLQQ